MLNYKFLSFKDISWKKNPHTLFGGRFTVHTQLIPLLWVIVRSPLKNHKFCKSTLFHT